MSASACAGALHNQTPWSRRRDGGHLGKVSRASSRRRSIQTFEVATRFQKLIRADSAARLHACQLVYRKRSDTAADPQREEARARKVSLLFSAVVSMIVCARCSDVRWTTGSWLSALSKDLRLSPRHTPPAHQRVMTGHPSSSGELELHIGRLQFIHTLQHEYD
jgi:hypothetical protein